MINIRQMMLALVVIPMMTSAALHAAEYGVHDWQGTIDDIKSYQHEVTIDDMIYIIPSDTKIHGEKEYPIIRPYNLKALMYMRFIWEKTRDNKKIIKEMWILDPSERELI